jgi:hypothetical protein
VRAAAGLLGCWGPTPPRGRGMRPLSGAPCAASP